MAVFDQVAEVYDETRRALDAGALKGLTGAFAAHGCASILEVGVGTGRVSAPLMEAGLDMTGVDVSLRMMQRARSKGLTKLVLGDGMKTPFRGGCFDGVLLAHVVHLIDDPSALLLEGARVGRVGVFALLRKRDGGGAWLPFLGDVGAAPDERERVRRRLREIAAKHGWSWDRGRLPNWERERDLLDGCPPDELEVVSDVLVDEPVEERVARLMKGRFGFMRDMPPEMKEEVAAEVSDWARKHRTGPRHEVHQLGFWRSDRVLDRMAGRGPTRTTRGG